MGKRGLPQSWRHDNVPLQKRSKTLRILNLANRDQQNAAFICDAELADQDVASAMARSISTGVTLGYEPAGGSDAVPRAVFQSISILCALLSGASVEWHLLKLLEVSMLDDVSARDSARFGQ